MGCILGLSILAFLLDFTSSTPAVCWAGKIYKEESQTEAVTEVPGSSTEYQFESKEGKCFLSLVLHNCYDQHSNVKAYEVTMNRFDANVTKLIDAIAGNATIVMYVHSLNTDIPNAIHFTAACSDDHNCNGRQFIAVMKANLMNAWTMDNIRHEPGKVNDIAWSALSSNSFTSLRKCLTDLKTKLDYVLSNSPLRDQLSISPPPETPTPAPTTLAAAPPMQPGPQNPMPANSPNQGPGPAVPSNGGGPPPSIVGSAAGSPADNSNPFQLNQNVPIVASSAGVVASESDMVTTEEPSWISGNWWVILVVVLIVVIVVLASVLLYLKLKKDAAKRKKAKEQEEQEKQKALKRKNKEKKSKTAEKRKKKEETQQTESKEVTATKSTEGGTATTGEGEGDNAVEQGMVESYEKILR